MKYYFLMLICTCIVVSAFSQTTAIDQVELHNGRQYQGLIIEQKPATAIRLWRLPQQDTLTFDMEEIARIVKIYQHEKAVDSLSAPQPAQAASKFNAKSWQSAFSMGAGGGDYSAKTIGFTAFYQFHRYHTTAGLGIHYVGAPNITNSIPITAHLSFSPGGMQRSRVGSALLVEAGVSFSADKGYYDAFNDVNYVYGSGKFIFTGFRLRVNITQHTGVWIDGGYAVHSRPTRYNAPDGTRVSLATNWSLGLIRGSLFF